MKLCVSFFFATAFFFAGAFFAGAASLFSSLSAASSSAAFAFGFCDSTRIVGCWIGAIKTSPALEIGASASAQNAINSSLVHSLISICSMPELPLTSSIILSASSVVCNAILNPNSSTAFALSGFVIISGGVNKISSAICFKAFTEIYALIFAISVSLPYVINIV